MKNIMLGILEILEMLVKHKLERTRGAGAPKASQMALLYVGKSKMVYWQPVTR